MIRNLYNRIPHPIYTERQKKRPRDIHLHIFCFGSVRACFYAPNFEEVAGAYWFRVVRPCVRE